MEDKSAISDVRIGLANKIEVVTPQAEVVGPGELGATYELIVREGVFDPKGKITNHVGPKISESFLKQFMDILWITFNNLLPPSWLSVLDTSGVTRNLYNSYYIFNVNAAIGVINTGIVVGTGNTAPQITDNALQIPILHDSAPPTAGRMQFGAVSFGASSTDGSIAQFTITRNFANASGGAITVNELGLYVQAYKQNITGGGVVYIMTIHDVIGGGILVPNGQTLTINYRPQATV